MNPIITKYNPTDKVFIAVALTDEDVRVVESPIQSVDITINARETIIKYNCQLDRTELGTNMNGIPNIYTVVRTDKKMYDTAEECFQSIVIKKTK